MLYFHMLSVGKEDLFGDNRSCVFRAQLRLRIFIFTRKKKL